MEAPELTRGAVKLLVDGANTDDMVVTVQARLSASTAATLHNI